MKVSWNWLSQWVDLEGLEVDEVCHRLTMLGLEVDGVEHIGKGVHNVVVARIDSIEPHPDADKLVVCQVDAGEGEPRQIVCGAKNMSAGDLVPAALPGAALPTIDFEIGERKMRGVLSQGMLCGASELGFEDVEDGLWILPGTLEVGAPIIDAMGLADVVIEISLTPNRPDCLSHMGVARELAAAYERELVARPEPAEDAAWSNENAPASGFAPLSIEDWEGCPRYGYAIIEGIEVGPSPDWLRQSLEAVGQRSVNNVVDITNYVLMDVGQPLHAFDLDKLTGPEIVVRRAKAGETIQGIDHNDYELTEQDLVIADAAGPVAIAGVMGGAATEVDESTTRILIECAYFDPTTVRRSAKRHKLHTESSHRFERGIDPGATLANLERAVALMQRATGGTGRVASGWALAQQGEATKRAITLADGEVERLLGVDVSREEVRMMLSGIGIEVAFTEGALEIEAPTWRPDLERPIDLIEEVARLHGYDELPERMPVVQMGAEHELRADAKHAPTIVSRATLASVRRMRRVLLDAGLHEAVNQSFMGDDDLESLLSSEWGRLAPSRHVSNPMNRDQAYLRTTLTARLLKNWRTNVAQRAADIALFELGRVWVGEEEPDRIGFVLSGRALVHWGGERTWDFFDAKGLVEALGAPFDTSSASWRVPEDPAPYLHPGVQAEWVDGETVLARVGQLHPVLAAKEKFKGALLIGEVSVDALLAREPKAHAEHAALSKFPAVVRDFALVQGSGEAYAKLDEALGALAGSELAGTLRDWRVFDVYEGEGLGEGERSVALQVTLRSDDRTLSDQDITSATEKIVEALTTGAGARLR